MKRKRLLPLLGALALVVGGTSCSDYYGYAPATKRGTVAGGLVGAGVGTIVGSQSDRPLEGAAIGGAIGALAGATLGSARDDERYGYRQPSPRYYDEAPYYQRPRTTAHYSFGYHYNSYRPRHYGHHYGGHYRGHSHGCHY